MSPSVEAPPIEGREAMEARLLFANDKSSGVGGGKSAAGRDTLCQLHNRIHDPKCDSLRLNACNNPLGVCSLASFLRTNFFALATLRPESKTAWTCRGVRMEARRFGAVGVWGRTAWAEVDALSAEAMARSCEAVSVGAS